MAGETWPWSAVHGPSQPHLAPGFLAGAPVEPLGMFGGFCFVRDASGLVQAYTFEQLEAADCIASLFAGAETWLERLWPREGGGWDPARAEESLAIGCSRIGFVDPELLGFVVTLPLRG